MKSKIHYILLVALLAIVFGCKDDPGTYGEMIYSSTKHKLSIPFRVFTVSGNRENIDINIDTDGTETNWKISGSPDWIKLSSTSGNNTETVTLQVSANLTTQRRTATLEITSSDMPGYATITVNQERYTNIGYGSGTGTVENPYNCSAAINYVSLLDADVESENDIFIKGYITSIIEEYSTTYGNASFIISDDMNGSNSFKVWRALHLGNQKYTSGKIQIQIGDEVVICGKVVNYYGNTPETVQNKAYLYSINGLTSDEIQSISYVIENGVMGSKYIIKGICTSILNTKYGNYYLKDDTGEIYIYGTVDNSGIYCFETLGISEGDTLTIEGPLSDHMGVPQIKNGVVIDIQKAGKL